MKTPRVIHRALDVAGRTLPHEPEAEAVVVGNVLDHPELLDDVLGVVRPDAFFVDACRRVLEAVVDLRAQSLPVELVTVGHWLKSRGWLEPIGGVAMLSTLSTQPTVADVKVYAHQVADAQRRRQLIDAASMLIGEGYASNVSVDELAARAMTLVTSAAERTQDAELEFFGDVAKRRLRELEEQWAGTRERSGVSTGYDELDAMTGGLQPGSLSILAAHTGGGKSALALSLAIQAAQTRWHGSRVGVVYLSLEMLKEELFDRAVCGVAGIDDLSLQNGELTNEQGDELVKACDLLTSLPIALHDCAVDLHAIRSLVRRAQQRLERDAADPANPCRVRLVIVDYLQLMDAEEADTRADEIDQLTRGLKLMAVELNLHIMALCQFNREGGKQPEGRPKLSDLKGSSAIEQHANLVVFVHRPYVCMTNQATDYAKAIADKAEFVVAKNRKGKTGHIPMKFVGEFYRFEKPNAADFARWASAEEQNAPRRRRSRWEPRGAAA